MLTTLAAETGAADPPSAAAQLHLLIEGANARMLTEGDRGAIEQARRAGATLLAAAIGSSDAAVGS